jgi:2,3,4,5-tetrahydropyridine-2-carboxylate N-succinyltransferase
VERRDEPAWGLSLATVTADGQVLDAWYPAGKLGLGEPPALDAPVGQALPAGELVGLPADAVSDRPLPGLRTVAMLVVLGSLADPPKDAYDVYLRLHLLSHRLVQPHQANLDGMFGLLSNVAWTSAGPCPPDRVDELRWALRTTGQRLAVYGVDKFPRMIDYVVPSGGGSPTPTGYASAPTWPPAPP